MRLLVGSARAENRSRTFHLGSVISSVHPDER
jgi:hypothetical protein